MSPHAFNKMFKMFILIPFFTQKSHVETLSTETTITCIGFHKILISAKTNYCNPTGLPTSGMVV